MHLPHLRRVVGAALASSALLASTALAVPAEAGGNGATRAALDWQSTAVRTVYVEHPNSPPVGALYLAFTSLAVREAVHDSRHRGRSSEVAAIATAAHHVLVTYFPSSRPNLDADLTASLATVPNGREEAKGVRIGRRAAASMVARRACDGRDDPSVVYQRLPGPGVWPPETPTGMAAAWLGFVDPLVVQRRVRLDGPDRLDSAAYAADYAEVLRVGSKTAAPQDRSAEQTAIAQFFTANPVRMYREALVRRLQAKPLGLSATVNLFAQLDAATADAFIQVWRLKYDVGFWRPYQAIAGAATDGNDATMPVAGWAPLVTNPAYSDYTSGHAAATSPFAEILRLELGDDTPLVLRTPAGAERTYPSLTALEHDAFHARIWGGLHFRDAMDDGYRLGHVIGRQVYRALG